MYRSGVPASITLAQGLLESNVGKSPLASEGNNHFGIKCHNWSGPGMHVDDDAKGECFRVYDNPLASFMDHSDFLRYRDRYKFLFENSTTDYKAWAKGLKKAGYATDPGYADKLIKLIEDNKLYDFDRMTVADAERYSGAKLSEIETRTPSTSVAEDKSTSKGKGTKGKASRSRREKRSKKKASAVDSAPEADFSYIDESATEIPQSPLSMEEPRRLQKSGDTFTFSMTRQAYSKNGVPFIYSVQGESIKSIAESNNLFVKEIMKFNDFPSSTSATQSLPPGTIIYVQPKKKECEKGLDMYIVDKDGEDLREISQRFAVKLESIEKMNEMSSDQYLREGDTVILRDQNSRRWFFRKK